MLTQLTQLSFLKHYQQLLGRYMTTVESRSVWITRAPHRGGTSGRDAATAPRSCCYNWGQTAETVWSTSSHKTLPRRWRLSRKEPKKRILRWSLEPVQLLDTGWLILFASDCSDWKTVWVEKEEVEPQNWRNTCLKSHFLQWKIGHKNVALFYR